MAKKPPNQGTQWTGLQNRDLRKYVKGNTPTRLIAHFMGRSESSVKSKASEPGISLKPVNKLPYNRRSK